MSVLLQKALKIFENYKKFIFKKHLSKDVTLSKLTFGQIAFQVGMGQVIESA